MTITLTKTKLAIAVVAIALIAPATALATHVFDDVDDGRFYAEPIEWAADNGITTGVSSNPPLFAPEDDVTRGEVVTFLKRYEDNLVAPAIDAKADSADVYTKSEIDAYRAANKPLFATIQFDGSQAPLGGTSGLVSSTRVSTGTYDLQFERDVENCAVATSDWIFATAQEISADPAIGDPDNVRIVVRNSGTNALADTWFAVVLSCPPVAAGASPTNALGLSEANNPND